MSEHPQGPAASADGRRSGAAAGASPDPSADLRPGLTRSLLVRPRGGPSGVARASRHGLVVIGGVLLVAWLAVVFGGALARVNAVQEEVRAARAQNAALEDRLEAGREEIALIQTEAFLSTQARAYGMGEARERAFALEAGASSPRPIVPLGSDPQPATPATPLEEWLALLFD